MRSRPAQNPYATAAVDTITVRPTSQSEKS